MARKGLVFIITALFAAATLVLGGPVSGPDGVRPDAASAQAQAGSEDNRAGGAGGPGGQGGSSAVVVVVPIEGTIEYGVAAFLKRALDHASDIDAAAVLLEIDTFGGLVAAATEMRDVILESRVPVIGLVQGRAWSAGALLALSCEKLAMRTGSSIGAAESRPNDEKTISAVRAEFEATARARGRDPKVAAAMVDVDIEIPGVVGKGKLLALAAEDAYDLGMCDAVVSGRPEALAMFGYGGASIVEMKPSFAELVARGVTYPLVAEILLTVGFLGIIVELLTPGFGIPGTVGLVSLALFFGGRMVAGLAGWEVVALFIAGFVLLAIEALVLPGFGVAGVLGIVAIFASLFLSFPTPAEALTVVTVAIFATLLLAVAFLVFLSSRRGPDRGPLAGLILRESQKPEEGYLPSGRMDGLLGKAGIALTKLRPVGTVRIEGQRIDAISEGEWIEEHTPVKVVKVEGAKVVVAAENGGGGSNREPMNDGESTKREV